MTIYAAQDITYDGVRSQVLFTRERSAKAFCSQENKKAGYEAWVTVVLDVIED